MKGKQTSTTKTPVKGGWVVRDEETGRLVEVRGAAGVARATTLSQSVAKEASSLRQSALKRLADR